MEKTNKQNAQDLLNEVERSDNNKEKLRGIFYPSLFSYDQVLSKVARGEYK